MCGIIGVTGLDSATTKILSGLFCLEYRGYDSAGLALFEKGQIKTIKSVGKIKDLENKVNKESFEDNKCGIGHTRWATHGVVSEKNSHPHSTDLVSVVHNGIVENYLSLREEAKKAGRDFLSETDTEVITQSLHLLCQAGVKGIERIFKLEEKLEGAYACGILFKDEEDVLYAIRQGSPLIIGLGKEGNFLASDISAISENVDKYIILKDGQCARITKDSVAVYNARTREKIEAEFEDVKADEKAGEKGSFNHFMLKEIYEQKDVFRRVIEPHFGENKFSLTIKDALQDISRVYIVGCGTAYHSGLVIKNVLENIAKTPAEAFLASEFRYNPPIFEDKALVLVISQSGETADTLAALKDAKDKGLKTVALVNVRHSSIDNLADYSLYLNAGREVSVASTKAYFAMVLLGMLFAYQIAINKGLEVDLNPLFLVPEKVEAILKEKDKFANFAKKIMNERDIFYIGRGIDMVNCMEASLKLKEISYIHSEAYAAGELKHGSIALVEDGTWVIGICSDERLVDKTISNLKEVKARHAKVAVITTLKNINFSDAADEVFLLDNINPEINSLLVVVATQLIAYYTAKEKGLEIDQPRNLAKSVTVE